MIEEVRKLLDRFEYSIRHSPEQTDTNILAEEICLLYNEWFLDWLTKHGNKQQVELFKEETR